MTGTKKNIALLLISLLVSLVMAEIFLRIFVDQETKRLAIFDEDLGWRGEPGGDGVYIRHRDNIRVPFHYNTAGFRDEDFPAEGDSSPQILFLGDSFVESLEVPFEQTFHDRVENTLTEMNGSSVAVINLSSQGYSTAQELFAYRKFRKDLRPKSVILVFYTGNDFTDNLRGSFASLDSTGKLVLHQQEFTSMQKTQLSFQRWVYENSHLVFFVKNVAENLLQRKLAPGSKEKVKAGEGHMMELTGRLIRKVAEEVRADGVSFGVVVFPSKKELRAEKLEPSAFVGRLCSDAEIPHLRLDSVLSEQHFFRYDEHLNEEGHRVAAAAIVQFITEEIMIDKGEN